MPATTPIGPQVRLRCLRVLAGVHTQDELRERIAEQGVRVTAAHLANVELGHQRASDALLIAWAHALGLNSLDVWQPARTPVALIDAEPDECLA